MMDFIEEYVTKPKNPLPLRLVVEKPDRLTRNFTNREQLQTFVATGRLEIHYYKDRRIFDQNCGPADIFTDDMMTSVSKYIALNIAREVKKGMRQKAESGWFPGHAPLGYKNVRDGKVGKHGRKEATIEIDAAVAESVKRVFEHRAHEKLSYENIAKRLKEEFHLHPKVKRLGKSAIEKMLKNPFYMGKYRWRGEVFQVNHEPLISATTWELCQNLRGETHYQKTLGDF